MVEFEIHAGSGVRVLMAVAAAHGFADVGFRPRRRLLWYLFGLIPMPETAVTVFFFLSSVVHFGRDVGTFPSAAAHLLAIIVANHSVTYELAFKIAIAYTALIHTPLFYLKLYREREYLSMFAAFTGTCCLSLSNALFPDEKFTLTHGLQNVATSHIMLRL